MDIDELSAFEEVTEEMARAREEAKAEAERIEKLSNAQRRMRCYSIDFQGAQYYFKQLRECLDQVSASEYNEAIISLVEVIQHEYNRSGEN